MVLGALLDVYIQKYEKSAPSSVNGYQPITSSPEESNTNQEQTPLLRNPTDSNSRHELNYRQNSANPQGKRDIVVSGIHYTRRHFVYSRHILYSVAIPSAAILKTCFLS